MSNEIPVRAEVKPEVAFLGDLVGQIAAGKVRVPRFQRGFVWKQQDLHALLDSVLRGFPIGSVLVWDTDTEITSAENIGPVEVGPPPEGLVGYLLDGQQRLSTLVGTLRLPESAEATVDLVDWRIYCDLETLEFRRMPASDGGQTQLFPMRSLLDTSAFFAACRSIESQVPDERRTRRWLDRADRLANAFRNYKIPVIRIREADLDTAVAVFARLNRTGREMAADEMVSALTYREGEFHLAHELDKVKRELAQRGFGNLDRVLLLRSVLAALDRDIYAKDWADLLVKTEVRSKLPDGFEAAVQGITSAVGFLERLGVLSDRLLPYGLQLVLLAEFFRLRPQPDEDVVTRLERWFWVTSFTGWFGGVSTSQATRALREIQDLARGTSETFTVVDLDAPAQPFPERFDGRSARVRAFLLYLASLEPCSLRDTEDLDVGALFSSRGTSALGYLAPGRDVSAELRSSPANRVFSDEQRILGRLAALQEAELHEVLPKHGFPEESIELLQTGDREGLISARLRSLIEGERAFLEARRVTLPVVRTAVSIADSDASDDDEDAQDDQ